jgi:hypothetical protein
VQSAELIAIAARDVSLCEYDPKTLSLNLEIQASYLKVDHERREFFRIGLLPVFVAGNVRISIASADCLTNVLPAVDTWRPPKSIARHLELRQLQISIMGKKQPCLSAAVACPETSGALNLREVVFTDRSGARRLLPKALLRMTGPQAGTITWSTPEGSPVSAVFLSCQPLPTETHHEKNPNATPPRDLLPMPADGADGRRLDQ